MIRGEYERNAEIASQNLASMKSTLEDLQVEKGLLLDDVEQLRSAKSELENEKSALVATIGNQKADWESQQTALAEIQNDLAERKLEQERVVYELSELQVASRRDLENVIERRDAIQVQLDRMTSELDNQTKGMEQNRQLAVELQQTIDRLSNVKGAMEVSVDELTQRLETKSTEHRKKSMQIHDLASRLEHLSDAVKTLSQREAELMRRIDAGSEVPAPHSAKSPSRATVEAVEAFFYPDENHIDSTETAVQRVLNTLDDWEQMGLS
jgi:chromosome segregation ATPase